MTHPLENNAKERSRFESNYDSSYRSGWRIATETAFGCLPTWAQRKANGQAARFSVAEAVARYRAGEGTLKQLAQDYGITPQALGYHVRKDTTH